MNQETRDKLYDIFDENPGASIEILNCAVENVRYNRNTTKSFGGDFKPSEMRELVKIMCLLAKVIDD